MESEEILYSLGKELTDKLKADGYLSLRDYWRIMNKHLGTNVEPLCIDKNKGMIYNAEQTEHTFVAFS